MRRILFSTLLFLTVQVASSQAVYFFKGEWTVPSKTDLFTCTCQLVIDQEGKVKAEFVWTYLAVDSTNDVLMNMYRGKKNLTGIEFAEGNYSAVTHDISLTATRLTDPHQILGMTKYYLKLSADKQMVYGTTTTPEGTDPGLFTAMRSPLTGKEFDLLKARVK